MGTKHYGINFTNMKPPYFLCLLIIAGMILLACKGRSGETSKYTWDTLHVTATAYNSVTGQTKEGDPTLTAWGDKLKPGMKAIAVSRDLIKKGLTHNTKVRIKGLKGTYLVKDKMNKRWSMKIDVYMGNDVQKAREWGKRQVTIYVVRLKE